MSESDLDEYNKYVDMDPEKRGYIAGLFDGDGGFTFSQDERNRKQIQMVISQENLDSLIICYQSFPFGNIYVNHGKENARRHYQWKISNVEHLALFCFAFRHSIEAKKLEIEFILKILQFRSRRDTEEEELMSNAWTDYRKWRNAYETGDDGRTHKIPNYNAPYLSDPTKFPEHPWYGLEDVNDMYLHQRLNDRQALQERAKTKVNRDEEKLHLKHIMDGLREKHKKIPVLSLKPTILDTTNIENFVDFLFQLDEDLPDDVRLNREERSKKVKEMIPNLQQKFQDPAKQYEILRLHKLSLEHKFDSIDTYLLHSFFSKAEQEFSDQIVKKFADESIEMVEDEADYDDDESYEAAPLTPSHSTRTTVSL